MNHLTSITNEQKQAYWELIEFFYPDYNPFANEFSYVRALMMLPLMFFKI